MLVWFIDETNELVFARETTQKMEAKEELHFWIKKSVQEIIAKDAGTYQRIRSSIDGRNCVTAIITQQYESIDGTYIIYFRPL